MRVIVRLCQFQKLCSVDGSWLAYSVGGSWLAYSVGGSWLAYTCV